MAAPALMVGLRSSSTTLTKLRNGTRSWLSAGTGAAHVKPRILHNYYATEEDTRTMMDGHPRGARDGLADGAGEAAPADLAVPESDSEADILHFVRHNTRTIFHPVGDVRDGHRGRRRAARSRHREPARRRCLCDADRAARQHQRSRDHGRREGRRPDPRGAAAAPPGRPPRSRRGRSPRGRRRHRGQRRNRDVGRREQRRPPSET